jgi:hypothetical protein
MARRVKRIAESGDKAPVPFTSGDGTVNIAEGYPQRYQKVPAEGGLNPDRSNWNDILNLLSTPISDGQQHTYPVFFTSAENNNEPMNYSKGAIVKYSPNKDEDGEYIDPKLYKSIIDDNNDTPVTTDGFNSWSECSYDGSWVSGGIYVVGSTVIGSNGNNYQALQASNGGSSQDPTSTTGYWQNITPVTTGLANRVVMLDNNKVIHAKNTPITVPYVAWQPDKDDYQFGDIVTKVILDPSFYTGRANCSYVCISSDDIKGVDPEQEFQNKILGNQDLSFDIRNSAKWRPINRLVIDFYDSVGTTGTPRVYRTKLFRADGTIKHVFNSPFLQVAYSGDDPSEVIYSRLYMHMAIDGGTTVLGLNPKTTAPEMSYAFQRTVVGDFYQGFVPISYSIWVEPPKTAGKPETNGSYFYVALQGQKAGIGGSVNLDGYLYADYMPNII